MLYFLQNVSILLSWTAKVWCVFDLDHDLLIDRIYGMQNGVVHQL